MAQMVGDGGLQSADIEHYRCLIGDGPIDEILRLAKTLKGVNVCQINSAAYSVEVAALLLRIVAIQSA